jgi:hypothetical protein
LYVNPTKKYGACIKMRVLRTSKLRNNLACVRNMLQRWCYGGNTSSDIYVVTCHKTNIITSSTGGFKCYIFRNPKLHPTKYECLIPISYTLYVTIDKASNIWHKNIINFILRIKTFRTSNHSGTAKQLTVTHPQNALSITKIYTDIYQIWEAQTQISTGHTKKYLFKLNVVT